MEQVTGKQLTNKAVMVAPRQFGFNTETAESNVFQHDLSANGSNDSEVQRIARHEFDGMVDALEAHGVEIAVLPSREDAITPDSLFPNNWFSHHEDGSLVIYPMLTPNRREEIQISPLVTLLREFSVGVSRVVDLSSLTEKGIILEGTGSLVLDRVNEVAFAMESSRTSEEGLEMWCERMGYRPELFHASDRNGIPIYHTNVMMSVGDGFAVSCSESITDVQEKTHLEATLLSLDKEVITISLDQMYKFCGNILQLETNGNGPVIAMSRTAFNGFTKEQRQNLERFGDLLPIDIPTIERIGGGSVRCMIAEVFQP